MKSLREHTDYKKNVKIVTTEEIEEGHTEIGRASVWTWGKDIIPKSPERLGKMKCRDVKVSWTHRWSLARTAVRFSRTYLVNGWEERGQLAVDGIRVNRNGQTD